MNPVSSLTFLEHCTILCYISQLFIRLCPPLNMSIYTLGVQASASTLFLFHLKDCASSLDWTGIAAVYFTYCNARYLVDLALGV